MKKKLVAIALAFTMSIMSGCSVNVTMDKNGNVTIDGVPAAETAEKNEDVPEVSAEPEKEADAGEGVVSEESGESLVCDGGSPWIDSDLKSNIKADMNLSPRDDFHLYVNHDWLSESEIPEGKSSVSSFTNVADTIREKALKLFYDDSLEGHDAELIKAYFNAILDWEARDRAGLDPIMDTVRDIQGISSLDELSEFICDPDKSPLVPHFVNLCNTSSYDDPGSYITAILNDDFTMRDAAEYKNRTEMGERYIKAQSKLTEAMLTRLGYSKAEAGEAFDSVIDLESKLAEVALTQEDYMATDLIDRINNVYEPYELDAFSGSFPLKKFIKNMGYMDSKSFLVIEPALMERLNEIYTEDNLEAMKAYMLTGYVTKVADSLDSEAYDASVKAANISSGSTGRQKDEDAAFDRVRYALTTPMDRAYLECYDASEKKEKITKICEDVLSVYRKMLEDEKWLSAQTRDKAVEKLDSIRINAVYPEKWTDYSGLDLKGLSLLECMEEIERFSAGQDRQKINGRVDHEIWDFDILESNAYYDAVENSITIILGILDEPLYYDGIKDEELLGGVGAVIGHEISHAFDTNGAQYDKDGKYLNWWKDEDYEAFRKRADRVIKYFDTITVWEGQKANGTNFHTETIADMAGIKAVLRIAENLDDFDYDKFFRAYAKTMRRLNTREIEYQRLTQDVHAPQYLRTNVTLQQFDEFYDTYGIEEGDNMYLAPEDRVTVW